MGSKAIVSPARAPLSFLGLACAIGVSNIYFNQPLLLEIGRTYGATPGQVGFVTGATQVGYAFGLLLFVPLGDVLERRRLMIRMYGAVILALLLVAAGDGCTASAFAGAPPALPWAALVQRGRTARGALVTGRPSRRRMMLPPRLRRCRTAPRF